MARPEWKPNEQQRSYIKVMRAGGIVQADIAAVLGVTEKTLKKHCKEELKTGKHDIDSKMMGALVKLGLAGNATALIFYLKTRCGWRETDRQEGAEGADKQTINISFQGEAKPARLLETENEKIKSGAA